MVSVTNKGKVLTAGDLEQLAEQGKIVLDWTIYSLSVASLAPAASSPATVQIQANSAFILDRVTYWADIAAAGQTEATRVIPLVTVQLADGGSGRQLFDSEVPISAFAGTGKLPGVLPQPRVFSGNSVITATFTNFDAANTYTNLYLLLHGRKVFSF